MPPRVFPADPDRLVDDAAVRGHLLAGAAPPPDPKADAELIQLDGERSEDERTPRAEREEEEEVAAGGRRHGPGVPLVRGQLAAVLAGVFVVLAVAGYAALLSWRRYLE